MPPVKKKPQVINQGPKQVKITSGNIVPRNVVTPEIRTREKLKARGATPEQAQEIIASNRLNAQQAALARQETEAAMAQQQALQDRAAAVAALPEAPANPGTILDIDGNVIEAPLPPNLQGRGDNLAELALGAGSIAGGAAAGASLGSAVPVAGTIGGAVLGAAIPIVKTTFGERQQVKNAKTNYRVAKGNFGKIINRLNTDPTYTIEQANEDWNNSIQTIKSSERLLKQQTSGAFRRVVSGGQDERIEVESFLYGDPASGAPSDISFLRAQFEQALLRPNPGAQQLNTETPDVELQQ